MVSQRGVFTPGGECAAAAGKLYREQRACLAIHTASHEERREGKNLQENPGEENPRNAHVDLLRVCSVWGGCGCWRLYLSQDFF